MTAQIISYSRVSSSSQKDGSSLEIQRDEKVLNDLSVKYNLPVSTTFYTDIASAYSGKHLKGELGVFLTAVAGGDVAQGSILVVVSLDRLSRQSLSTAKTLYNTLMTSGIRIYSVMDNTLYEPDCELSEIKSTLVFSRSSNESKTKSFRTISKAHQVISDHQRGVRSCDGYALRVALGNIPWWIATREEDLAVVPHPEYFDAAKQVIELIQQGYGIKRVCEWLSNNYPERKWGHSTIATFAKQKALYGERTITIQGVDYTLDNYYPELVDRSTWYALQKTKRKPTTTSNTKVSLLTGIGICKCIECGSPVSQQMDYSHGKPTIRLFCSDRTKSITGCAGWSLKAAYPEKVLMTECKDLIFTNETPDTTKLDSLLAQKDEQQNVITDIQAAITTDGRLAVALAPAITSALDLIDNITTAIDIEQKSLSERSTASYSMETFTEWSRMSDDILIEDNEQSRTDAKVLIQQVFNKIEIGRVAGKFVFKYHAATGKTATAVMVGIQRKQKWCVIHEVSESELTEIRTHSPEIAHLYHSGDLIGAVGGLGFDCYGAKDF